jgi:hypothetical protein
MKQQNAFSFATLRVSTAMLWVPLDRIEAPLDDLADSGVADRFPLPSLRRGL